MKTLRVTHWTRYYNDVRGGRQRRLIVLWRGRVICDLPFGKVKGEAALIDGEAGA